MNQFFTIILISHITCAALTVGYAIYGWRAVVLQQLKSINRAMRGIAFGTGAAIISGVGLALASPNSSWLQVCRNLTLYLAICLISETALHLTKLKIKRHGNTLGFAQN